MGSRADAAEAARHLRARGYDTTDLSENELAKLHVRHMVGGRSTHVSHERVCRFAFPDRPSALSRFLDTLGERWNISLFHYRNHGSDFGRVVAGFEVPDGDVPAFTAFLDALGHRYEFEDSEPRLPAVPGLGGLTPPQPVTLRAAFPVLRWRSASPSAHEITSTRDQPDDGEQAAGRLATGALGLSGRGGRR